VPAAEVVACFLLRQEAKMTIMPGPTRPYFHRKKPRVVVPLDSWYETSTDTAVPEGCQIWAYQAVNVADYATSLINLADPGTDDLTTTSAPAWNAARGWIFTNANSTFLDTGVIPTADYSWLVRFSSLDTTAVNSIMGEYSATSQSDIDLYPLVAAKGMIFAHGTDDVIRSPVVNFGVFGMAGRQPYRNGLPDGAAMTGAGWTEAAVSLYIGALNNAGGGAAWCADVYVQAVLIAACTLDPMSMLWISWAMNSL
jgi:hypothetical protein